MITNLESRDGFDFAVTIEPDYDSHEPWREEAGHGEVSEWRRQNYRGTYDKAPGELLLCEDHRSALFYDFAGACALALRGGWNAKPYDVPGETPKQRAAKAARADYERLRRYCAGDWCYVGVVVTASRDGVELGSASLWGLESDCDEDHLADCACELAEEALDEAKERLASLCQCDA